MKQYTDLYSQIYSFDNLYWAYRQARLGKRHRPEVQSFEDRLEEHLITLQNELMWRTYRQSPYKEFYVHEPKKRLIMALPFRDRVVQWSIYQTLGPILERKYIYDSYACRIGRGVHSALDRLRRWLRGHPECGYVLKLDIHKYFYRVNHDILLSIYGQWIGDDGLMWLLDHIIRSNDGHIGLVDGADSYCDRVAGVGMAVGNLVSQMSANVYLNELDQFAKHRLRLRHYIRYMDDVLVLGESKQELHRARADMETYLADRLALRTNGKTQVRPISQGIEWIGYRVWPTHAKLRKSTAKRMRRRLKWLQRHYESGDLTFAEANQSIQSYFGMLGHCDSYRLRSTVFGPDGWFVLRK